MIIIVLLKVKYILLHFSVGIVKNNIKDQHYKEPYIYGA
jgi:hypothetical protein